MLAFDPILIDLQEATKNAVNFKRSWECIKSSTLENSKDFFQIKKFKISDESPNVKQVGEKRTISDRHQEKLFKDGKLVNNKEKILDLSVPNKKIKEETVVCKFFTINFFKKVLFFIY